MKNLIGFIIIVITLVALFGNAIHVFASPQLVKTEGLYQCLAQSSTAPAQDGNYPPEGYHCRMDNGTGETIKKQNDSTETIKAVKIVETVEVIEVPAITETVEVVEETPTVEDETCKNKNSGKDGTPNECNAGIGQEKNGG
jgi:hypothetical protein